MTSPQVCEVLSVNFGRPNISDTGVAVPSVALLGSQTSKRLWRSFSDTYFVMVILTWRGTVRLFPDMGLVCRDEMVDFAALEGDASSQSLRDDLSAALKPRSVATQLDQWFTKRLDRVAESADLEALSSIYGLLLSGKNVQEAAKCANLSRRTILRWFQRHLGVSPKKTMEIERLQSSLTAVQSKVGDALSGYSDQAHQIRSWRSHLGLTPGRYLKTAPSSLSQALCRNAAGMPAYYL